MDYDEYVDLLDDVSDSVNEAPNILLDKPAKK